MLPVLCSLQTQNVQLNKEMTLASNRSLAEGNLLYQPQLDARKARLTQKYQELQGLFEAYQIKKTQLGNGAAGGRGGARALPQPFPSPAAEAPLGRRGRGAPGPRRQCWNDVTGRCVLKSHFNLQPGRQVGTEQPWVLWVGSGRLLGEVGKITP